MMGRPARDWKLCAWGMFCAWGGRAFSDGELMAGGLFFMASLAMLFWADAEGDA